MLLNSKSFVRRDDIIVDAGGYPGTTLASDAPQGNLTHLDRKWPRASACARVLCARVLLHIILHAFFEEVRSRGRSWPFGAPFEPAICISRALSDAPISVAKGRDLGPLRDLCVNVPNDCDLTAP